MECLSSFSFSDFIESKESCCCVIPSMPFIVTIMHYYQTDTKRKKKCIHKDTMRLAHNGVGSYVYHFEWTTNELKEQDESKTKYPMFSRIDT